MKKKVTKTKEKTILNFILDESGSMSSIKSSVISGFNEYVQGLRKGNFSFTLTKFDSMGIRIPYVAKDIKDVEDLTEETYLPGQMTPLYDAVCRTIKEVEKKVKDQPVLIAIMTDGQENDSQEFTQKDLSEMIKRLQKKGNWTFVFMGANQDSWATARQWGISRGNTMDWQATHQGTQSAFHAMAASTVNYSNVMEEYAKYHDPSMMNVKSFFVDKGKGKK